jgi:putative transposase
MKIDDFIIEKALFKNNVNGLFARILYVDNIQDYVVIIEFNAYEDAKEFPFVEDLQKVKLKIDKGHYSPQGEDPFFKTEFEENITIAEKERLDRRWEIIAPLVRNGPRIFFKKSRGKLISNLLKERSDLNKIFLYSHLKRYWIGGCSKYALLSNYANCGGKGKIRSVAKDKRKRRGRRTKRKGIDVGPIEREMIVKEFKRLLRGNDQISNDEIYNAIIEKHYGYKDRGGKIKVRWSEVFSKGQFNYWVKKLISLKEILIGREGFREYNSKHRAKRGSVEDMVFGAGSSYQIDSTLDNCHLVLSLNRNKSIGRAYVYIVRDVYTRMITGLYVTLDPPSYITACMAIENSTMDKVEFCKRYDIHIKKEDWPCDNLAILFMADNAELVGKKAKAIVEGLGSTLTYAAAGRGDGKAIVERGFRLIQNRSKSLLNKKGGVDRNFGKRTGTDSRKYSRLTLRELYRILIHLILEYNSTHPIRGYPRTAKMIAEDVKPIPLEIWRFAKKEGLYAFSKTPKNLWNTLIPKEECVVTDKGILFMSKYWTSSESSISNHLHDLSLSGKKVLVAFDPRYENEVFLVEDKKFIPLVRTGQPVKVDNLYELKYLNSTDHNMYGKLVLVERVVKMNTNREINKILDDSLKYRGTEKTDVSDIKASRKIENKIQHKAELTERRGETNNKSKLPLQKTFTGRPSFSRLIKSLRAKSS